MDQEICVEITRENYNEHGVFGCTIDIEKKCTMKVTYVYSKGLNDGNSNIDNLRLILQPNKHDVKSVFYLNKNNDNPNVYVTDNSKSKIVTTPVIYDYLNIKITDVKDVPINFTENIIVCLHLTYKVD